MVQGAGAHDFLRTQGVRFLTVDAAGGVHQETP